MDRSTKRGLTRISKNIKAKLQNTMGDSSRDIHINIRTSRSDVELAGIVDALSEKKEAEDIASTVPGVKRVINHISVSTDGTLTDNEIEEEVNKKLRNSLYNNRFRGVTGKVSGGTAVLVGQVETQADRKKALEEASKALGVKDVVNNMEIASYEDDIGIANEINRQYTHSYIDIQDVSTVIEDGLVHLYGYVNNRAEEKNLIAIAEEVDGVKRIASHLEIRDWSLD